MDGGVGLISPFSFLSIVPDLHHCWILMIYFHQVPQVTCLQVRLHFHIPYLVIFTCENWRCKQKIISCHIGFKRKDGFWFVVVYISLDTLNTLHRSQVKYEFIKFKLNYKLFLYLVEYSQQNTNLNPAANIALVITNFWLNNHIESVYNWIYLEGMQCISKINTRQPLLILSNVNHSYLCMQMKKKQSFSETFLYLLWKLRNLMP